MEVTANMKNNVIKALALLLSVNCCFPGMLVKAEEAEKEETAVDILFDTDLENLREQSKAIQDNLGTQELPQFYSEDIPSLLQYQSGEEEKKKTKDSAGMNHGEQAEENAGGKDCGLRHLQIPQKLEVVIDPWEIDGKGQIYSEEYTIRNTGEMAGTLTLSRLACKPQKESNTVVKIDKEGVYDNGEKSVYMEMVFENGSHVILSEAGSEYQVKLKTGEELSFQFTGEVNEYAEDKWANGDIEVDIAYSWSMENETGSIDDPNIDEVVVDKDDASAEKNTTGGTDSVNEKDTAENVGDLDKKEIIEDNVSKDENIDNADSRDDAENGVLNAQDDRKKEFDAVNEENDINSGNQTAAKAGNEETDGEESLPKIEESLPKIEEFSYEQDVDENKDGKVEIIDLKEMQKARLLIDSWRIDEEILDKKENQGIRIISTEYVMRNTGETTGILTVAGLRCKAQEQSRTVIIETQEELNHSVGKVGYIEMITGDGENEEKRITFQEGSEYQAEVKSGEEISIRFVGEVTERLAESWEKGGIEVAAVCLWKWQD